MKNNTKAELVTILVVASFIMTIQICYMYGVAHTELKTTSPYVVGFFNGYESASEAGNGMVRLMKLVNPSCSYSYVLIDESQINSNLSNIYSVEIQQIQEVTILNPFTLALIIFEALVLIVGLIATAKLLRNPEEIAQLEESNDKVRT